MKNDGNTVVFRWERERMRYLCTLEQEFVRNECDKLAVCGFVVGRVDFDPENVVDVFDFSAIPGDFDCVAYRAFDF